MVQDGLQVVGILWVLVLRQKGGKVISRSVMQGGGNLDEDVVLRWLRNTLASDKRDVIFHNALYDVGWLRREGVHVGGKILDTIVAAPLVNENRYSYSLDNLGEFYCNEKKDESLLQNAALSFGVNPKSEMYKLPSKFVGPYGEQDAALTS